MSEEEMKSCADQLRWSIFQDDLQELMTKHNMQVLVASGFFAGISDGKNGFVASLAFHKEHRKIIQEDIEELHKLAHEVGEGTDKWVGKILERINKDE